MYDDQYNDDYQDDDSESSTIACPSCGAGVYEDSPRCPACGDYITDRPTSSSRSLLFIVIAIIIIVLIALSSF